MDNKIKLAIETFYGIPIPPDADMIQQTINLTDVVGILEIYAAQQSLVVDACPACEGVGNMSVHGLDPAPCSACNGTGKRH